MEIPFQERSLSPQTLPSHTSFSLSDENLSETIISAEPMSWINYLPSCLPSSSLILSPSPESKPSSNASPPTFSIRSSRSPPSSSESSAHSSPFKSPKSPKRKSSSELTEDDEMILKMLLLDNLDFKTKRHRLSEEDITESTEFTPKDMESKFHEIRNAAIREIKKVGHHQSNKPRTIISVGIPNRDTGLKLLKSYGKIISSSKAMTKVEFDSEDIQAWFGMPYVPRCKFTGKLWVIKGDKPPDTIRVNAYFDRAEVKIKDDILTVEFRTFMDQYHNV